MNLDLCRHTCRSCGATWVHGGTGFADCPRDRADADLCDECIRAVCEGCLEARTDHTTGQVLTYRLCLTCAAEYDAERLFEEGRY